MYGSEETFNEFCKTIKLPRLKKYLKRQIYTPEKIILDYKSIIKIVEPFEILENIQIANQDRDDDVYFRVAKASGAKIVVSGDKKHVLSVKKYDGIIAVSVSKFVNSFTKLKSSKIY